LLLVIDEVIRLIVRNQKIDIQTDGRARVDPQFLEGDGALGNAAGVFDDQDIARHQMGTGDARKLGVGKVPRLDTEDHTDRAASMWPSPSVGWSSSLARKRSRS
jgi:hypothetical protein